MQSEDDFGLYYPDDITNIALCGHLLRQYGILPSQAMKEITENWELLHDVLTYNRLWHDVPYVEDELNGR